jgi:phosphoribosyl 1,2-cyclic phosphodiesterase
MRITFWGVRGSIPTPGVSTVKYGGNTACIELHLDNGKLIILDAGTGIRDLGNELVKQGGKVRSHILITHLHWDHIQGFPFFKPAYVAGNELTIVGPDVKGSKLADLFAGQMNKIYFPVGLSELDSKIDFIPMKENTVRIEGAKVQSFYVNHPGFTIGYRITHDNKSLAYVSDNEPFGEQGFDLFKNGEAEVLKIFRDYDGNPSDRILDFISGVDVLIHDTTYTPELYSNHVGWGHSHFLHTLELASEAGVKNLFLFHYDPSLTDEDVDNMLARSAKEMKRVNYSFKLFASREGLEFKF